MAKVVVDKEKCIGCGGCEVACPEGFEVKDGKAHVKNSDAECVKEAANACPVQAISVN